MSKFVKKVGNQDFYEIDGIRAAGIIPYYKKNDKVYILINQEYRKSQLLYNVLGGKVDKKDIKIEDTMIREFNEETGFLMSDKINFYYKNKKILNNKIHFSKPKYMLSLLNIQDSLEWQLLPYNYNKIFNGIEAFNDRDSEQLIWVDLFDFNDNMSYLLTIFLFKIRNCNIFRKYNTNKELLFID